VINQILFRILLFASKAPKWVRTVLLTVVLVGPFIGIIGAKLYQFSDSEYRRGAIEITDGAFGENYSTPEYLKQGWDAADSLWFYNTTQGSALLPYDFLLALEQPGLKKVECERNEKNGPWFLCDKNIDRFRYLPQRETLFNPDALPVGFTKETYDGKDYVGFACAACHTGQINFRNPGNTTAQAIRIDGGPAMADMVAFLTELTRSMKLTRGLPDRENRRLDRFVENVLALDNDYNNRADIEDDLKKWTKIRTFYDTINEPTYVTGSKIKTHRKVDYGYARLDAFGRIYNRVIQHAINKEQVASELSLVTDKNGDSLLTSQQIAEVVEGVGDLILRDDDFTKIVDRLRALYEEDPVRRRDALLRVRDKIFNAPNAPVSYPFLWDITHSDYVQWNGLASNAGGGPLGRNAGEVIGVFAILDWQEDKRWFTRLFGFSLSAVLSGQRKKRKQIYFKSSVDLFNLQRLESHLGNLESPRWPFCNKRRNGKDNYYLPTIPKLVSVEIRPCGPGGERFDQTRLERGRSIFAKKCQTCHDIIKRDAWDRLMVSRMSKIGKARTDKKMASNSVKYIGKSGNFKNTYQKVRAGRVVVKEKTPVVQILTAATAGVIGTADPDKWLPRRIVEWVYALVMTFFDNPIKDSVKSGQYDPDTTAEPYRSLLSYRARSLNGIWATAPYLHNGSVPTLYDLLLPVKCKEGTGDGKLRPRIFTVGEREFDPAKVGFTYTTLKEGENLPKGDGRFKFDTSIPGNANTGHDYGACIKTEDERLDLIEYLKSL